jgi:hypothetical protein
MIIAERRAATATATACLAMSHCRLCGGRHVHVCGGETSRVPFWDPKGDVGIIFFTLQVCSLSVLSSSTSSYHVY